MFICSFSGPLFIEHFRVGCIFTLSLIFAKYFVAPPPRPPSPPTPILDSIYCLYGHFQGRRVYLRTFANFREFCWGNDNPVNCLRVVYLRSKPHKKELERTLLNDPNCPANFALLIFFIPFETSVSFLDTWCTIFVIMLGVICTLSMSEQFGPS